MRVATWRQSRGDNLWKSIAIYGFAFLIIDLSADDKFDMTIPISCEIVKETKIADAGSWFTCFGTGEKLTLFCKFVVIETECNHVARWWPVVDFRIFSSF